MKLQEFDFELPKNLIAQKPASPRDHSRLLVFERRSGRVDHRYFYDLPDYLGPGDVLVLNNTKVIRARLIGKRKTGGKVEIFLLRKTSNHGGDKGEAWQCLVGGKKRKENLEVFFRHGFEARVSVRNPDGTWQVSFNMKGKRLEKLVEKIGQVPLPPYIKRNKKSAIDGKSYQTVFAAADQPGSVAAPTAGLHFTSRLLKKLVHRGVRVAYVTLHVGLGTFMPVKTENIEQHPMHAEFFEIRKVELEKIIEAKKSGGRIIAVGTTSARALETVFRKKSKIRSAGRRTKSKTLNGWTDIFIYPGYKFRAVDALITNFHLPKSTLLMLTSAFAGRDGESQRRGLKIILHAYRAAIKNCYRFYSYGDAMLII